MNEAKIYTPEDKNSVLITSKLGKEKRDTVLKHLKTQGIVPSLPEDVVHPDNPIMDSNTGQINYKQAFIERIISIHRGAKLIVQEYLPDKPNSLDSILDSAVSDLNMLGDSASLKDYKQILKATTDSYMEQLQPVGLTWKSTLALLDKAESYAIIQKGRPHFCAIFEVDGHTVVQYEEPMPALSKTQAREFAEIARHLKDPKALPPQADWYLGMGQNEKRLLNALLKKVGGSDIDEITENVIEAFYTIPSKLRTIPGLANHSRSHLIVMDKDNKVISHKKRVRHAFPASRDLKNAKASVGYNLAKNNLLHMMQTHTQSLVEEYAKANRLTLQEAIGKMPHFPISLTTLITPLSGPLRNATPDRAIYEVNKAIIREFKAANLPITVHDENGDPLQVSNFTLTSSNHPVNVSTMVATSRHTGELNPLLDEELSDIHHRNTDFESIPRLFKSVIEQYITLRMGGIASGCCMSAKDRKEVETQLSHALLTRMAVDYEDDPQQCNDYLKALNTEMLNYSFDIGTSDLINTLSKTFTQFFLSGAGQTVAASNAPGCYGTKTLNNYLKRCPWLESAIMDSLGGETKLKEFYISNNALAKLNGMKECVNKKKSYQESPSPEQAIAPEDSEAIIKVLQQIISHPVTKVLGKGWPHKIEPKGIRLIRQILHSDANPSEKFLSIKKLEHLQKTQNAKRDDITQKIYSAVNEPDNYLNQLGAVRDSLYGFDQDTTKTDEEKENLTNIFVAIDRPNYAESRVTKALERAIQRPFIKGTPLTGDALFNTVHSILDQPRRNSADNKEAQWLSSGLEPSGTKHGMG